MKTRAASKRQRVQVTHRVLHITDLVGSIMPFMDSLSLHNLASAASSVQLRSELQQELKERRVWVDQEINTEVDLLSVYQLRVGDSNSSVFCLENMWKMQNLKRVHWKSQIVGGKILNFILDLPPSVRRLTLGSFFNFPVSPNRDPANPAVVVLPKNLTHLQFGYYFNAAVVVPEHVTHLNFGGGLFNQPVIIPAKVTHLTMSKKFNHRLELPPSLTHLTLGKKFSHVLTVPPGLTHLTLGGYDYPDWVKLSSTVTHLTLDVTFRSALVVLPPNLKTLIVLGEGTLSTSWPSSLTKIVILHDRFNQPVSPLPNNLKKLLIDSRHFNQALGPLPNTLQNLQLGDAFNHSLGAKLPSGLLSLSLGDTFNQKLGSLPPSLKILKVGRPGFSVAPTGSFNFELVDLQFTRLIVLVLGDRFNQSVHNLPLTLKMLKIGCAFNQKLKLPPGLEYLYLSNTYNHSLVLPASLLSSEDINVRRQLSF